jgi:mono/diheme cytochrome c family protein
MGQYITFSVARQEHPAGAHYDDILEECRQINIGQGTPAPMANAFLTEDRRAEADTNRLISQEGGEISIMLFCIGHDRRTGLLLPVIAVIATAGLPVLAGCGSDNGSSGLPAGKATLEQVIRGRAIVTSFGCIDCHNRGKNDPSDPNWLAGYIGAAGGQGPGTFNIGPFQTYAANLTPDTNTGIGTPTERQIFNALRFGLDPMDTPDVVITSTTPGQGNFPATPHYLAPPMPWYSIRNMSDDDLWAIVAYLKHGIKAVANTVPDSQGPPDFWAGSYTPGKIGPNPLPPYPTTGSAGNEQFQP